MLSPLHTCTTILTLSGFSPQKIWRTKWYLGWNYASTLFPMPKFDMQRPGNAKEMPTPIAVIDPPACSLFIPIDFYLWVMTVLSSTQNGFPAHTIVSTAGIMTYKSQTGLSKQRFYKTYLEAPQPFFPLFVIIWQVMCYTCHYLIWLHTRLQIPYYIFPIQPF